MRITQPMEGQPAAWRRPVTAIVVTVLLSACVLQASPSPSASATPEPSSRGASAGPTSTIEPSPSEAGRLRLPAPKATDTAIPISYKVTVQIDANASGRLVVVVTNLGDKIVPELVLRWPTEVRDTIFLAPFTPSKQRIREGGDPLVQDWTKWVDGPGESGEPAGTTSLGWGPLLVGGTLTIPILANRVAPGPISFDLQILNGEAVLQADGVAAWTHVEVP